MKKTITSAQIRRAGVRRIDLARRMRMSYPLLSAKMCGYVQWKDEELLRADTILSELEAKKKESSASAADHAKKYPGIPGVVQKGRAAV